MAAILTALFITGLYQIFISGQNLSPELDMRPGQISDRDITAPFDFPVLKSDAQFQAEKRDAVAKLPIPYRLSEDHAFEQKKKLDDIFTILSMHQAGANLPNIETELGKIGFDLDETVISTLIYPAIRNRLYDDLVGDLARIYGQGVYQGIRSDSIYFEQGDDYVMIPITRLLSHEEAMHFILRREDRPSLKPFMEQIAAELVSANVVVAEKHYNAMKDQAVSEISLETGIVLRNEEIIRKNTKVSEEDVDKLTSLRRAYRNHLDRRNSWEQVLLLIGLFVLFLMVMLMTDQYLESHQRKYPEKYFEVIPVNLGYVLIVLIAIINNTLLGYSTLLIPFSMTVIAVALLISYEFGVFYAISGMIFVFPFVGADMHNLLIKLVASLLTVMMLRKMHSQTEYLTIWLYLFIASMVGGIAFALYKNDGIQLALGNLGLLSISSVLSVVGLIFILPFFEKRWHRATKQTLLELLDFNHPLLKRLSTEAAGTYHHSLIVGNLSEQAAEAIGANPLLARVGSYYHDIGKLKNKDVFTENNENSNNFHHNLEPRESAAIIKDHVRDGIDLARKYKIPKPVIDIIRQHHGTSSIRYFLDKAEKSQQPIDLQSFLYDGPKPRSKEAALVMLSDIVESTSKAKNLESEDEIIRIIEETTIKLIKEGQFDDAPITIRDLAVARDRMSPILASIYRKRLDYPPDREHDNPHPTQY